ncbi:MAG: T9SS type A sorting domain-containing protein [Ignavibacteria bacterium]|nr:T9SS type A sorting domain-containing protein [Ignavibacteria bacterium]
MKKTIAMMMMMVLVITANVLSQTIDSTTLNASNITGTVSLTNNKTYIMKGFNYVRAGGVLVIQKGSLILGDKASTGTLIVERGGKIIADGTASQPIVFTSRQPIGIRGPGDWGGIVILGRSGINTSTGIDSAQIEGFPPGTGPWYGGQPVVNDDSSGVLRYVRLEFPGVNLTGLSGNEINGLTMGGVGSRTVIEHIMVSYCGDDSYEWFGGTVNAKYLISYRSVDDDFDADNGHRGKVQFGLAIRDTTISDVSASHIFEIDNNNNNPSNFNTPRTRTLFSNITGIGPRINNSDVLSPNFKRGAHLRRNMLASIYNSVITGYPTGILFDGKGVQLAAQGDTIQLRNNIFAGFTKLGDTAASSGSGFNNPTGWLNTGSFSNRVLTNSTDVQLTNMHGHYSVGTPANNINYWMPVTGSPALTGANFSNPNLTGFEVTTFVGAFGTDNWTAGWANFNPKNYTPVPIGIKQVSTEIPSVFKLNQNYPNPFNPSTKISFSVPQSGFVSLKVYDLTGREVANLVNNKLEAGTYEYDFDGSKLTSGIYFYRINAGSYSETMKMMLIK